MLILGIESSCDDTAIAIIDSNKKNPILSNIISSQIDQHRPYGGVVPEIAARNHVEMIDKLFEISLNEAKIKISDLELIAATGGPGLIGGVITSVMFAKGLALANNIPFCGVNHLEGHALIARIEQKNKLDFPFLLFLASGGHCQILVCNGVGKYQKYGQTLDDAIGEAFDKTAKIMGLPYPGGPEIEKIALNGDMQAYNFPKAMQNKDNCNFSLSGLKTAVRYTIDKLDKPLTNQQKADIAASFQFAVTYQIENRLNNALNKFKKEYSNIKTQLVFAGGVAANKFLGKRISNLCARYDCELIVPETKLCTDNAAMIAWAGYENYQIGNISDLSFQPRSRWNLY